MMHFIPSKVKNAILNDVACLKWLYCSTRLLATAKSSANKQVDGGEKGGECDGGEGEMCCTLSIINLQLTSPDCRTAHKKVRGKARQGATWIENGTQLPAKDTLGPIGHLSCRLPGSFFWLIAYVQRLFVCSVVWLYVCVLCISHIIPASKRGTAKNYIICVY